MKKQLAEQVTGFPVSSASYSVDRSPEQLEQSESKKIWLGKRAGSVTYRMNKLGKKAGSVAHKIREHVRLGPKITETLKGKLSLGARILQLGGVEKVFKQLFSCREGEKLLNASQCYLSTTSGPIAGLLFISTEKVSFCSERSIKISSPNGDLVRVYYKATIPLSKMKRIGERENFEKPSQKYIEIVTVDNFDFWFMGFLNYQRALRHLQQALLSQS